jgi:GWxTD domain-containing protein
MPQLEKRRSKPAPAIFLLVFAAAILFPAASGGQKPKLPEPYQKWLDEEVAYIITPLERDVFLKLQSDRERDLFIEAFWRQRDPTPNSPLNEAKNEHYRRINYVNRYFGRSAGKPGWKTDRGRVYILLGEPNDIQRFEGKTMIYPTEIWFYQNKEGIGLPMGFNLVFFQEGGLGDYKLYSPAKDGPQALMTSYAGDPMDYIKAYQALRELEPALADVSLSLIPGETATAGRPTLASDMLIQKIENAPRAQVEERYAQKFLEYKDIVEVEYSSNYMVSDALVKIVKDPSGLTFVHYAVEPKRLSVNAHEGKYYTTLKINGTAATLAGQRIYQFEKTAVVNLDEAQTKTANAQPFDFLDLFPLIPGTYKLSILVKNEVSKEFTSLEQTVVIPGDAPALQMTSPFLGYKTAPADPAKKTFKPFQFGSRQVHGQPSRIFARSDTLTVAFQVFGFVPQQRPAGRIRFAFQKNGQPGATKEKSIADCGELPFIFEEFPLAEFAPAHYVLRVSLMEDKKELLAATEEFDVTFQSSVPRPWFYSKLMPDLQDPLYGRIIGGQLFNAGRPGEARVYLEKALQADPAAAETALILARVSMSLKDFDRAVSVLDPFIIPSRQPQYEIYTLAGQARQMKGDLAGAVDVFDRAVSHFGVNAVLLNAVGECRLGLGQTKEALAAWEKSLELDPNQPEIRKKADTLKGKK